MSLKTRLTLFFFVTFTGVMLILAAMLIGIVTAEIHQVTQGNLELVSEHLLSDFESKGQDSHAATADLPTGFVYQLWSADAALISASLASPSTPMDESAFKQDNFNELSKVRLFTENYYILTTPFKDISGEIRYLQVGVGLSQVNASAEKMIWITAAGILTAGLLFTFVWWLILDHFSKNLHALGQMTRDMANISTSSTIENFDLSFEGSFKDLANTIAQTREKLEQIFKAHNQFLVAITHDLRTPLTVIKGNIGLMRMMKHIDHEALNAMDEEIDRLDRLVNDMLVITQSERGEFAIEKTQVRFDQVLQDCIKHLKVIDQDEHQISLDSIEPARVDGNEDRLKQVILNLGVNALKFTPPHGKVRLGLRLMQGNMFFWVADTGEGIPESELSSIFTWNYSGSNAQEFRAKERSFGLGLYITNSIVKLHGGHIEVESKVGVGTTFYVWLPLSQDADQLNA